jgi:manganese/iron transport system permease protein
VLDVLLDPLALGFMQRAMLAGVLVGTVTATIGVFVVLRGLGFLGDAVSHAAFPGVVVAFLLGAQVALGALVAAVSTAALIAWVSQRGALRADTAIGVIFAGMFALGVLLLGTVRGYTGDLMSFLFGNVLSVAPADLLVVGVLGGLVLLVLFATRKELVFASFDPLGARAAGLPVSALEYLLLVLLAVTIAVSIQVVGIILVMAMLITPAAAARQLSDHLPRVIALSVAISIGSVLVGLYLSFYGNWASGATIVLLQTAIFLVTLLVAPRRAIGAAGAV